MCVRRNSLRWLVILMAWAPSYAAQGQRPDVPIADFEGTDYGQWKVAGEAFGAGPAHGTLPGQMEVSGFEGKGLVNSFYRGDGTTGTLTSPLFTIERKYVNFLVGGGGYAGETCMDLLVDGKVVRTATGPNTRPGGSEKLDWHTWDVGDLEGKEAVIRIVDRRTGGWGHINIDQIVQSDKKRMVVVGPATREIALEKRYLHLPVKNGAPMCRMTISVGNQRITEFEIELAPEEPDFWTFLDGNAHKGKSATIEVDQLREDSKGLAAIRQSDELPGANNLYKEKYRPQFHFSSRRGWNNDPNGLVYCKGEYHLFYQHNPYGWPWGNMHWGHAISRDLVHWKELGDALYPDEMGTMFSGSAVVDEYNTTGFQAGDEKPIICAYTAAGGTNHLSRGQPFTQCLAYSLDRGRSWMKYGKNPVLPHIVGRNRDPKVIWYAPARKWVMALFLDRNDFALFDSPDLKTWKRIGDVSVSGAGECPEFFELPVDGDQANARWVFYGGNGRYLIGRFDGKTFRPESGPHRFNYGNCFYASQTFNNIPPEDGRRIQIAWGRIGHPSMPFNQMMDFPVELTLRTTDEGIRMFAEPIDEIERLHARKHSWSDVTLKEGENPLESIAGDLFHIVAEFDAGDAREFGFRIRSIPVTYHTRESELSCRGEKAPLKPADGRIRLEILVDRTSVEIFANDGRIYMPIGVIPPDDDRSLEVFSAGGDTHLVSLDVYELCSAWE